MKIAIILPAWNEALTIAQTIAEFAVAVPTAEIWVIDNNSTDQTAAIARNEITKLNRLGGVLTEKAQGKSSAVRRAFFTVNADVYLIADADATYSADDAAHMVQLIVDDHADMVVGDRQIATGYQTPKTRPLHSSGNWLVTEICNLLYNGEVRDAMSGYRAFSSRFVLTYPIVTTGFELEVDLTLHAMDKRLRIVEVPTSYRDRPPGSNSKLRTFSDGFQILWSISLIVRHYRPITYFGLFAFCLLFCGVILYSLINLASILSFSIILLLCVSAILLVMTGLILDSIAITARRNFEILWLRHRRG